MTRIYITAIVAAFLCSAYAAPPIDYFIWPAPLADGENYRLPLDIMPVSYNIWLRPLLLAVDVERFTFDGEVTIEIVPKMATNKISLHTKNLKYTKHEMWSKDAPNVIENLDNSVNSTVTDIITYTLKGNLQAEKSYILHFVYSGTMDDDMHGFYRSSYVTPDNVTKWIGSTQFQRNHARRAFPSFDEPKFKATYTVSLERHKSMNTVANTRLVRTTAVGDDYEIDEYAPTPKMSTYILAFIVSEFKRRNNTQFGVVARPEYYDQTQYSFDIGQKLLSQLDKYLDMEYYSMGVDKMDLAAIPDFSAGAMENWGLLTYRERALLYDEGNTTLNTKQYIAGIIAHEQAHMWFGDLVTCDWWSYTWLNEGFASYFQYFATAEVEKGWEMDKQFVVSQLQTVMNMDSTNKTNPMSDEDTNTPADLGRMFNSISYNKAASIIRMVNHVMGEENFQKAMQEYLKTNKYTNTVPKNLFDSWKKQWPSEYAQFADPLFQSFTEQVGYPVVHVTLGSDGKSFEISQKRFLLKENDGADSRLLYTTPITYTTDQENNFTSTKPKFFLPATTDKMTVNLNTNVSWIIVNIQEVGYYRVNYNEKAWHSLHHALYEEKWSNIHELNRAQIADDLLNLARSGQISYDLALQVLEYLETETNYLPWTAALNGYSYLAVRLGTDTKNFGFYMRELMDKVYKMLGFEERNTDSTLDIYNRAKILSWSCKYGNTECISKAKSYFQTLKTKPVPVNIRSVVYCTAMREGNEKDFDDLFNKYKTDTVATEQTLILNSLGCVKDKKLVEKYFNIIMGDEVRRQDKSSSLSGLYSENNENVSPVFELVTNNVDDLAKSMGGYSAVASVISSIASRFTEPSQETALKEFNSKNKQKFGSSASTLESAEKTVAENLKWASDRLGVFKQYLEKRVGSGSATLSAYTLYTLVMFSAIAMLFH